MTSADIRSEELSVPLSTTLFLARKLTAAELIVASIVKAYHQGAEWSVQIADADDELNVILNSDRIEHIGLRIALH